MGEQTCSLIKDLIVADDEYAEYASFLELLGEMFERDYKEYGDILAKVCNNAVSDGVTFENLVAFGEMARTLQGQFDNIMRVAKGHCTDFVANIDNADKYLYD
jgi:hypothetical protein